MELKNTNKSKLLPLAMAGTGYTIWGFSFMFSKIALRTASPDILLSVRFVMAAFIMTLMIIFKKAEISLRGKKPLPLIILALLEPFYFYFESYGIVYSNATFSGAMIAAVPVLSIITSMIFLKEYPTKRQAVFCLLPVAGVIIMTLSGKSLGIVQPLGVILLLGCCLSAALYKTANRRASEEFTTFERTYAVIVFCAFVFTIVALNSVNWDISAYARPLSEPTFLIPVLILSIFCSVVCNMLINYAAARTTVAELSSMDSLTPLFSIVAGVVFLGEPITAGVLLGAAMIIIGIREITKP